MDNEVIAGLIGFGGAVVGAAMMLFGQGWFDGRMRARHARYLAIRAVCVLDKYVEDCAAVVADDGLSYGQRDKDGYLQPQVAAPSAPGFPEDLDWRSIDHALMYRLLSMPNETEAAASKIDFIWDHVSSPPDFDEYLEERQSQYARLGLGAFAITQELRSEYDIPPQELGDWNPIERLTRAKEEVEELRRERSQRFARDGLLSRVTKTQ